MLLFLYSDLRPNGCITRNNDNLFSVSEGTGKDAEEGDINLIFGISSAKLQKKVSKFLVYLLLTAGGVIVAFPFYWMLSTALKVPGQEFASFFLFPRNPQWINFVKGWTILPFTRWLWNTVIITGGSVAGQILSGSLIAFGFARTKFRGRDFLFLVCLSSLMIPFQVTMVPQFILFKHLGWLDTFKPLIVPFFFGGNPFFIFLLRQFFLAIPSELDQAARIDGCGTFGVFTRIVLPLSKPALGIVAIFSFMWRWNDFLGPLIFLNSTKKYTLALGLRFFRGQLHVEWTYLMAVSFLVVIPCLILFFIAQRYYIQGIVMSGIKG